MFLPMKIASSSKGEPARRAGIWLGTIDRTEETIIGTKDGVVKCRTLSRLASRDQWDSTMVLQIKGLPWEPVLGRRTMQIPVDVQESGDDIALNSGAR